LRERWSSGQESVRRAHVTSLHDAQRAQVDLAASAADIGGIDGGALRGFVAAEESAREHEEIVRDGGAPHIGAETTARASIQKSA